MSPAGDATDVTISLIINEVSFQKKKTNKRLESAINIKRTNAGRFCRLSWGKESLNEQSMNM